MGKTEEKKNKYNKSNASNKTPLAKRKLCYVVQIRYFRDPKNISSAVCRKNANICRKNKYFNTALLKFIVYPLTSHPKRIIIQPKSKYQISTAEYIFSSNRCSIHIQKRKAEMLYSIFYLGELTHFVPTIRVRALIKTPLKSHSVFFV